MVEICELGMSVATISPLALAMSRHPIKTMPAAEHLTAEEDDWVREGLSALQLACCPRSRRAPGHGPLGARRTSEFVLAEAPDKLGRTNAGPGVGSEHRLQGEVGARDEPSQVAVRSPAVVTVLVQHPPDHVDDAEVRSSGIP